MLLIIIAAVLVGTRFSKLAFDYDKNRTSYVIYSILMFFGITYGLQFISGIILGLTGNVEMTQNFGTLIVIGLITLAIGGISVWRYYVYLQKKWSNEVPAKREDILD